MICSQCGKENEEGVKECVACGAKLETVQVEEVKQETATASKSKECKKAKTSLITAIVGLIIAGIICGTYALVSGIQSLKEIKAEPELKGKGNAIAGIVIGVIDIILAIYSMMILF